MAMRGKNTIYEIADPYPGTVTGGVLMTLPLSATDHSGLGSGSLLDSHAVHLPVSLSAAFLRKKPTTSIQIAVRMSRRQNPQKIPYELSM